MTEITNQIILEEIQKNRTELKYSIEASEARLLLEVAALNNKIVKLEIENTELKNKIEELERQNRQNNIVIFGLETSEEEINGKQICQDLKRLIHTDVIESDINNCYRLGKSVECPIKVEFVSYLKKKQILANCKNLKGTNVYIAHDLTPEQRNENQILRRHLNNARQNKNNTCFIKNNKLHINKKIYTPNDLLEIEESEVYLINQNHSAPSTPTTFKHFSTTTTIETISDTKNTPKQIAEDVGQGKLPLFKIQKEDTLKASSDKKQMKTTQKSQPPEKISTRSSNK